jgi:hypothetical protein
MLVRSGLDRENSLARELGGEFGVFLSRTTLTTKVRVRVYAVASYSPEGGAIPGPEAQAVLDAPRQLHLIFERGVDGATMAKA